MVRKAPIVLPAAAVTGIAAEKIIDKAADAEKAIVWWPAAGYIFLGAIVATAIGVWIERWPERVRDRELEELAASGAPLTFVATVTAYGKAFERAVRVSVKESGSSLPRGLVRSVQTNWLTIWHSVELEEIRSLFDERAALQCMREGKFGVAIPAWITMLLAVTKTSGTRISEEQAATMAPIFAGHFERAFQIAVRQSGDVWCELTLLAKRQDLLEDGRSVPVSRLQAADTSYQIQRIMGGALRNLRKGILVGILGLTVTGFTFSKVYWSRLDAQFAKVNANISSVSTKVDSVLRTSSETLDTVKGTEEKVNGIDKKTDKIIGNLQGSHLTQQRDLISRGDKFFEVGKFNAALQCFNEARKLSPVGSSPWIDERATRCELELKRFDSALNRIQTALAVDSTSSLYLLLEGICLSGLNREKEALLSYSRAVDLIGSESWWQQGQLRGHLLRSLLRLGQVAAAVREFEKIKANCRAPRHEHGAMLSPDWMVLGAIAYYSSGDVRNGFEYLEAAFDWTSDVDRTLGQCREWPQVAAVLETRLWQEKLRGYFQSEKRLKESKQRANKEENYGNAVLMPYWWEKYRAHVPATRLGP